jgi:ATP-binding cassette subfamily F protein uup
VLLVSHDRDFLDKVATSVIASEGNGRWIEYAGGYSDMLAQRPAPPVAATAVERPIRAAPRDRASGRERLSYNDRRALEMLPARIASLQARIGALNALLADPGLYLRDPARFTASTSELAAARDELNAAEEQWLMLEMLREEIEGIC